MSSCAAVTTPIIGAGELPEPHALDAEAYLDRLEIQNRQIATGGDAGPVEQRKELRRGRQHIDGQRREKLSLSTPLDTNTICNPQSAIRTRR